MFSMETSPVIIDNGSGFISAGFGGDDAPRAVFPTIVGRHREKPIMIGVGSKSAYIGDEAKSKRAVLSLKSPIEHGIVTNWDDMERVWHHCSFNELRVAPDEHIIVLTESPLNPKTNREKMAEICFETFATPGIYIGSTPHFTLYGAGRTTGIGFCCGHGVTCAAAISNGFTFPLSVQRADYGGGDLTHFLAKMLKENKSLTEKHHLDFSSSAEYDIIEDAKCKIGYVALDFQDEIKKATENSSQFLQEFQLPDQNLLTLKDERFRVPEALFNPSMMGTDARNVQQIILDSLANSDPELQRDLSCNIVLSGATTLFENFAPRLEKELKSIEKNLPILVVQKPERRYLVWIGASIFSSLAYFNKFCAVKEEYDEFGPSIAQRFV